MDIDFSIEQFRAVSHERKEVMRLQMELILCREEEITEALLERTEDEVWKEINCLQCAGCCRFMGPELTRADQRRIASHLRLKPVHFAGQYLEKEDIQGKAFMKQRPCIFLNPTSFHCRIYPLRPEACAGFPHLTRTPFMHYAHMHLENSGQCPATALFLQKLANHFSNKSAG